MDAVRAVVEVHAEVSVHDGFVKSAGVAVAEGSEGFCVLCLPGKDYSSVIDMGFDDNELGRVSGTDDAELPRVAFELRVAEGENGGSMIVVEDLVGCAGSIDASEDSKFWGDGEVSIAQSRADIRSKLWSGRNLSFKNRKKRKKIASGRMSVLFMNCSAL